ncbi:MAG: hypothetical protein KF909_07480 [Rhodocyclaceae bacterium]|nr:hypothetical protein [Rhodocyclaceae bacterium]MCP5232258.1 hypothetical protein [Zoogloeaceae bacterium]MCP5241534.1 hypothetical protein [Zoogloeaceae bacterium]MCP5256079.1 hypothetical protein [Zoogloeaceae bacterium]MCP5295783.1 hypothetical protein [Zoogloeaceae bacterium]
MIASRLLLPTWTCALLAAAPPGAFAQAPPVGTAPLSINARVSLASIEATLRRTVNDGKAVIGSLPTAIKGLDIRYRAEVDRLTVAGQRGELAVGLPVLLALVASDSSTWLERQALAPVIGAIEALGCGSVKVATTSFVKLATREGSLSAQVRQGAATSQGCAKDIASILGVRLDALLRETVGARVGAEIAAALGPTQLAALVSHYQDQAIARFSRPQPLPLEDTALVLDIDKTMALEAVVVLPSALHVGLQAAVSPQIVFDGAQRTGGAPGAGRGFRLPIDIVIPLRALPQGSAGAGLEMAVAGTPARLRLSRVPSNTALLRLGLLAGKEETGLVYFALRSPAGAQSTALPGAAVEGTLDELLGEAAAWLAEASNWPTAARHDAGRLAGQVAGFRRALADALARLGEIPLRPGVSFSLRQPQIRLGAGRFEDDMIRIPAELSGFAKVELAIE